MLEKNITEEFTLGIKSYLKTNWELTKLETIQKTTRLGSTIISKLIISVIVVFFVFFLSIAAGFYLSELLHSQYLGFALVAGIYFLLFLIMMLGRKKILETPIQSFFIKKILGE
jgi:ABC-type glycerol-3-phosphate transport system permease component